MSKTSLQVKRVPLVSLLKIFGIGLSIPMTILGLISGIMGFLGFNGVMLNGQQVYGFSALVAGPLISIIVTLFLVLFFGFISWLGLRVFCKFRVLNLSIHLDKIEPARE
ncbi:MULTISPECIES: hypothetical protein [Cedecea]|uniref:DUF3566 domain-containing protein n=1 Tax=Cedecea neteri TaxID=158822 RepID=A0A089PWI6_9ENTR|nr:MULTISPECIES: hypothetical protein [Cedecea]AIR03291.1 hypothetical protein JT31_01195 [Cedecea neteri]NWC65459.1 hypothetical protein [Cedecea sp. P7760]